VTKLLKTLSTIFFHNQLIFVEDITKKLFWFTFSGTRCILVHEDVLQQRYAYVACCTGWQQDFLRS